MDKHDRFQKKIDQDEKIEPKDWKPERYKKQLIRMMSQHAHSELVGMLPEGNWITRAPTLKRKLGLLAKVQDEAGHGMYIYSNTETLGISRRQMIRQLLEGEAKYSNIFNYPTLSWADIGMIGWLVDGAAMVNQTMLAKSSYGPYSRAMIRICKEENFHRKQGHEMVATLANGIPEQQVMVQDALDRWWWPTLMMFGPPDSNSPNSNELMQWKIKRKSNDELRQDFIDRVVPEAHEMGLEIPDPQLTFNEESGHWETGPIDWDEFWSVIRGNGPMNRERLEARQNAHESGEWVRKAAEAYAQKHNSQQKKAS